MPAIFPCHGISALTSSSRIIVHRDFDLFAALKCHYDFDGNVAYSIVDSTNEPKNVLWGFGDFHRSTHWCPFSTCCPRDIDLIFIDRDKMQVMNIIREGNRIAVYSPISHIIGWVEQKIVLCKCKYKMIIRDHCGRVLYKVCIGPKCSTILKTNNDTLGSIKKIKRSKTVSNFLISVPESLDVEKKALLIGATIFMDQYYGEKNKCPKKKKKKGKC